MKIKKPLALGLVAGIALSTFAVAGPAFADPVSGSYVAVGSDTLDASINALANGTTVTGSTVRITGQRLGDRQLRRLRLRHHPGQVRWPVLHAPQRLRRRASTP